MSQSAPMSVPDQKRLANVLAAFALALTDKINEAIRDGSGRSTMSSATLVQIGFNPGLSIEGLRTMIGLSHSATVRIIDQLEADGLVVRERNSNGDSRVSSLLLTESGGHEMEQIIAARSRIAEPVIGSLNVKEIALLSDILEKAIPKVVEYGTDQDIVCRLCDMESCPQDICPVNTCVDEARTSPDALN